MKRLKSLLAAFLLISSLGMPSVAATTPSPKIIGGDEASISDVPWQVGLLYNRNLNNFDDQFCGGSLIHTQWVLTAAHCVVNDSNQVMSARSLVVLAGADYLDPTSNNGRLAVSRIYVHPGYSAYGNEDDVALLRLSRSVTLIPSVIQTISLPFQKNATSWPASGTEALVSGWGSTANETPSYPADLMRAAVEIASDPTDEFCGDYPGYEYDRISMLCAGDIPDYLTDTCWGDSGGPLAILEGDRYLLAGVTSWGYGCAEANYPGIYARVTTYLAWIDRYVDFPAPRFSSVSPSRGSIGETVTVRGSNLNMVEDVLFGDVSAEFTVLSATSLSVSVPAGAVTARITLVGEMGESVSRSNFTVVIPTPEISRLNPSRASVGDVVAVTGRNLSTVSAVTIGGISAVIVDGSITSTSLSFIVPAGARTNRIVVTNDFGVTTSRARLTIR